MTLRITHTHSTAFATSASPVLDHADPYYLQLDAAAESLVRSVQVVAAHGCPEHDSKQLCSCEKAMSKLSEKDKQLFMKIHWVLEWEQHLIKTDAAFAFTNDSDQAGFTHLTSMSPVDFARRAAEDIFAAPAMIAPSVPMEDATNALLEHWSKRAAEWRSRHNSKEAARAAIQACQPGDADSERYRLDLSTANPEYPPQPAKDLVLQRMRAQGDVERRHVSMIHLLPLRPYEADDMRYEIVGVRPCHEDCSAWRLVLSEKTWTLVIRALHSELQEVDLIARASGRVL